MKDHLSYIDNITGDKLKSYTVTPVTSWEQMNSKLADVVSVNIHGGFFSAVSNFFTKKIFVASVVILSVLSVSILILKDKSGNEVLQKDSSENIDKFYHESDFNTVGDAKKSTYVVDDSLINLEDAETPENNLKDVFIKVEVPIRKNVIIKREIIIKDTINNTDNVK